LIGLSEDPEDGNTFSVRHGYQSSREIQIKSIDKDLRTRLWNIVYDLLDDEEYIKSIWRDFHKRNADALDYGNIDVHIDWLKREYESLDWYRIYDLLEFIVSNMDAGTLSGFIDECNRILRAENSGYRFINNKISPITTEQEILEIDNSLKLSDGIGLHLEQALDLYSDRTNPDYRNSIKESISAVEAMCKKISKSDMTLGKALVTIEKNQIIEIAPPLKQAFEKIYGYTSSSDGIRHALTDMKYVDEEDARFMLVACSAFVNYLQTKADKSKIWDSQKNAF
jgi:hypothetical protein